jgi:tRNA-specific adenosine deaminase 1
MYCSEAPCGDASMELVMDAQEDATPWTTAPPTASPSTALPTALPTASSSTTPPSPLPPTAQALRGRSNFSLLGAVRCKPSRPDAPPTLSKSCTDKLALKQATSLLSSLTSTLISPHNAYLHSLVLPCSQFVPSACTRAFSRTGRLQALDDKTIQRWKGGYRWHPFQVKTTAREFQWSRRTISPGHQAVASNLSAAWTPSWQETLIGGVLQGRKQLDPRGASSICRVSLWKTAVQLAGAVGAPMLVEALSGTSYKACKDAQLLQHRRRVKHDMQHQGLDGWIENTGDEDFSLPVISES